MSVFRKTVALSAAFGVAATLVLAGGHGPSPQERAVKARQSLMTLRAYNISILGAMAKGDREYDADAAALAAANLATLSGLWMPDAWAAGTDSESVKGSNALPKLWQDDMATVGAKAKALSDASADLAEVAGTDLAALRGGIGAVGQACGACHKAYRAEN
jgi:cytochrome c556